MFKKYLVADPVKSGRIVGSFNFNIAIIFVLAIINVLYKIKFSVHGIQTVVNLWNPTWMLFGPFLFFADQPLKENGRPVKLVWLHYLPAIVTFVFFCITTWRTDAGHPWSSALFVAYQNSFFVIPLSLIPYAWYMLFKRRKVLQHLKPAHELLFLIAGLYMIIAFLNILMYICWGILSIDMGIDYRFVTYGLLVVIAVFILRYVRQSMNANEPQEIPATVTPEVSYANSTLKEEQVSAYIKQIQNYFEDTQAFLRPDLSLDVLSKELHIPKHHFSQLFNIHIGKGFYNFIAEYRIDYAMKRLASESGRLKIESLSYECGFNSKTSFNRHFKNITGYTPFEYVNLKIDQELNS